MIILITGAPGTGKSTAAKHIADLAPKGIIQVIDGCPKHYVDFIKMALGEVFIIACQQPEAWVLEYPGVIHLSTVPDDFWQKQWDATGNNQQPTTNNQ